MVGPVDRRRLGGKRMLDTFGLGQTCCHAGHQREFDRREDSKVGDTPRQEELDLSSASGPADSGITTSSEPVQAGLFPDDSVPDELVRLPRSQRVSDRRHHLSPARFWAGPTWSCRPSARRQTSGRGLYVQRLVLEIVDELLDTSISLHDIRIIDDLRRRGVRDLANVALLRRHHGWGPPPPKKSSICTAARACSASPSAARCAN